MWRELAIALGLLLVIEGILPFVSPGRLKAAMLALARLSDQQLRFAGLTSMLLGLLLLYAIR